MFGHVRSENGYVEVLGSNGTWGRICDFNFDNKDADVICKMLGFPKALKALAKSADEDLYGPAPSDIGFVLENITCTGNEDSIFECPHPGEWEVEGCDADQIAGVQCATSKLETNAKQD